MINKLPDTIDIVVMDNISFHHSKEVRELANQHNVQIIFTPPYSPEFNPIEIVFSLLKRMYRAALNNNVPFCKAVQQSLNLLKKSQDFEPMFNHSLINECQKNKSKMQHGYTFIHCFIHK